MDDAELMRRVQGGDEAALGALMERWELPVKRLLARLVYNVTEADDLAQESFVRVWSQREKFRTGAPFRPWLFAIALNLARNRLRWWRRRPEIALEQWEEGEEMGRVRGTGEAQGGAGALERAERKEAVRAAVAALPGELREALVLFEYEEMSHAEIAEALGCTPKAVEARLYRARAALRKTLAYL
jgi:RNA polymerase sigma factor (sigma-70 family)